MSRNRKDFKTFYRFDGNGRIIPGSNILKKGYKPEEGTWQESSPYECCAPVSSGELYWALDSAAFVEVANEDGEIISRTSLTKTDSEGNGYRLDTIELLTAPIPLTSAFRFVITKQSPSGEVIWQKELGGGEPVPVLFEDSPPFAAVAVASNFIYVYFYMPIEGPEGPVYAFFVLKLSQTDGSILEQSNLTYFDEMALGDYVTFYNILVDSNDNLTVLLTWENNNQESALVAHHCFEDDINNQAAWFIGSADINYAYGTYATGKVLEDDSILISMNGENIDGDVIGITSTLQFTVNLIPEIAVNTYFKLETGEPLLDLVGADGDVASVQKDNDGEYYVVSYSPIIIKMNAAGDAYSWAYADTTGDYSIGGSDVDSAGNLYVIGEVFNSTSRDSIGVIAKITPAGNLEWAYSIYNATTGLYFGSDVAVISIENDIIYLTLAGIIPSFPTIIRFSTDMKLPTDRTLTPGTYGDYEVADITAQFASDWDYPPTTGPAAFTNPAMALVTTSTLTSNEVSFFDIPFSDVSLPLTKTTLK